MSSYKEHVDTIQGKMESSHLSGVSACTSLYASIKRISNPYWIFGGTSLFVLCLCFESTIDVLITGLSCIGLVKIMVDIWLKYIPDFPPSHSSSTVFSLQKEKECRNLYQQKRSSNDMTIRSFATLCGHCIHSDMLLIIMEYLPFKEICRVLPGLNKEFGDFFNRNDILYKILLKRDYHLTEKYLLRETWKTNFTNFNPKHKRIFDMIKTNAIFQGLRKSVVMNCCQLGERIETTETMSVLEPKQVSPSMFFLLNGVFIGNGERTNVGSKKECVGIALKATKSPPEGFVWGKNAYSKKKLWFIDDGKLIRLLRRLCSKDEVELLKKRGVLLE